MRQDFTSEEKLVLENLRLKVQLADVQKQHAAGQLAFYTRELLRKYEMPEESVPQLMVTDMNSPAPTVQKAMSQAEAEAVSKGKKVP